MIKRLVGTDVGAYTFNPATNQITITGVLFTLEQLLNITNLTSNANIFNAFDPAKTATLAPNALNNGLVLTLAYNCAAMGVNDRIQIYVDIPDPLLVAIDPGTPLALMGQDVAGNQHPLKTDTTGALITVLPTGPSVAYGVDAAGNVHQLLTDANGQQKVVLTGLNIDALGQLRTRPADTGLDADSLPELLTKILLELKELNFFIKAGFQITDDAAGFPDDPSFNLNKY